MDKQKKINLLARIGRFLRSHSPARKLTPETLELSVEEATFIKGLPQLNRHGRFTYEFGIVENRPALIVKDHYCEPLLTTTACFIPSHGPEADDYAVVWLQDVVRRLNAYGDIEFLMAAERNVRLGNGGK